MSKKRGVNSVIASIARPPNYRARALEVDGRTWNMGPVLDHRDGDDPDERDGEVIAGGKRDTETTRIFIPLSKYHWRASRPSAFASG
jgi:hypothetical protein